ncbi:solute carrier organic anion transporter family member 74D-like [Phlebotomus papatasi]|uniref:solute carrier organic anion transporter family member 74D-like n=1 Tax=Phlebotomus papatasi TaxID=29031 RepID=UPI0024834FF7|nr:solute carrier organic anion transporter family member 74D-like [Phlebotomus papatasi]
MTQEDIKSNQKESDGERFITRTSTEDYREDTEWIPTKDTTCGIGPFNWPFLQKFANKNVYVVISGISGAVFMSRFTYFYGTISTIEKRFKIPNRIIGLWSIGHEMVMIFVAICVTYLAGKGHKPRWIGIGLIATSISCLLMAFPHFIYGGGSAESFTLEYGSDHNTYDRDHTLEREKRKDLCNSDIDYAAKCDTDEGHTEPQIIFFAAQMIAGIGSALFSSLSSIYMDDNVKKENTPFLISIMFFLGMTGPLLGFALAGLCVKLFVSPSLTPTIADNDPRWVGSWWLGWIVLSSILIMFSIMVCLFPKIMPSAARRKRLAILQGKSQANEDVIPASWNDFLGTIKRLLTNKIYVLYNITGLFSVYGMEPYFMYTPKYIESLYQKTPTESNFYTGTVGFIFTGIGTILSGFVMSRYKPSAKKIVIWNCVISFVCVMCNLTYSQLGCTAKESVFDANTLSIQSSCIENCNCDFVQYAPVCGEDNKTYISACHAGCRDRIDLEGNSTKLYINCTCIASALPEGGSATEGACPIDCKKEFTVFLVTMSFLRLMVATGMASNFLLCMRCVAEKDKTVSLGLSMAFYSILGFMPIPVVFGALVDSTCDLWGKTCTTSGNCWLYNGPSLRYLLNLTTSFSNSIAFCLNIVLCYFVRNLSIFDEENSSKNRKTSEDTQRLETTNF